MLDGLKKIKAVKTTKQVEQFLSAQNVDLVHNNSLPALAGMEAAYNLGIPYICHIREQIEAGLGLRLLNPDKHFRIVKKASGILAISDFVCSEYSEVLKDVPIRVIHDGFDTSLYLNPEKKIFRGKQIHVGIYGNLDPQKGQLEATKAVGLLRERGYENIILHIIGNQKTGYAEEVRRYAAQNELKNIVFSEPIKDLDALKQSRAQMDINLVCSSAEGLGRVTVESMLSGCLTIGARAGATPEIIRDGENGMLYECHSITALADRIEWAIQNHREASVRAELGRTFASTAYDINRYTNEIQEFYRKSLMDGEE